MENAKATTCSVCFENFKSDEQHLPADGIKCRHSDPICPECWNTHIETQLSSQSPSRVTCIQKCGNILGPSEIRAFASAKVYSRYLELTLREKITSIPDFVDCIAPGCGSGHIVDRGCEVFICSDCGHRHCIPCGAPLLEGHHKGETCEVYQAMIKAKQSIEAKSEDDEATARFIQHGTLPCPKCSTPISKNGGCDHITCTRCSFEFCWLCLANWTQVDAEGDSAHQQDCRHFVEPTENQALGPVEGHRPLSHILRHCFIWVVVVTLYAAMFCFSLFLLWKDKDSFLNVRQVARFVFLVWSVMMIGTGCQTVYHDTRELLRYLRRVDS